MPNVEKYFSVPDHNNFICYQVENGYVITNNQKEVQYRAISKIVTTKSVFRVVKDEDGPSLATVIQHPKEKSYKIKNEHDMLMAEILLSDKDSIQLSVVGGEKLKSKILNRAKQFEFKDKTGQIRLTVDKKLIALKDSYTIKFAEEFPALIAGLVAVVIDDHFHMGVNN